ncbi:MAG: hypothetical protein LC104_08205 [Bacteroidales bacterium]|nr:hypothetical protein [Bacteroidales bacterium]
MSDGSHPRWTTRDLPLAAKLVLTIFLIAVGLGYFSAMVQLHLQHSSRQGEPLPSFADVVEHFSGLKPFEPGQVPKSKIETIISGSPDTGWGKSNMTPAFFSKSSRFEKDCQELGKDVVTQARDGERQAMIAWIQQPSDLRKKAYDSNALPIPDTLKNQPITEDFVDKANNTILIADIIDTRCVRCHKDGDQQPALQEYAQLEPLITAPPMEVITGKFGEKWVRSGKQVTIDGLTQSTHAHLLSFAVLFTLTGLITALSSLPGIVRGILAPIVLLAQIADVSCWWLARVPDCGPYFAQTIILTGTIVGVGLVLQILGGMFSMYGLRGKSVLVVVCLIGLAIIGAIFLKVLAPALQQQKAAFEQNQAQELAAASPEKPQAQAPAPPSAPGSPSETLPQRPQSQLEKLVMGATSPSEAAPWDGTGSMGAAFFARDGDDYKDLIKERPQAEVDAEREGERLAVQSWIVADPATRQAAYAADAFVLPPERAGKPITARYLTEDKKSVTIKTLLTDRCVRCHAADGDVADYPLETYEQLLKYMGTGTTPAPTPAVDPPIPPSQ